MLVTFSSSVAIDDDPTLVTRFPSFNLTMLNLQPLESLRDEHLGRYGLSFAGPGVRAAQQLLASISVPRLVNGEPDESVDGLRTAAATVQGELVTMEFVLYDGSAQGEAVSRTGVMTNLVWAGGSGGAMVQRLDLVFYSAHRLVLRSGGTVTVFSAPGIVQEPEPEPGP